MFSINCMKNMNYLYLKQQEIFLKWILLIYNKRKSKKLVLGDKTYVCNKERKTLDNLKTYSKYY
jgi:hypothetical protein